jgi:spermidine/putrescine transport system substrate-binding protein
MKGRILAAFAVATAVAAVGAGCGGSSGIEGGATATAQQAHAGGPVKGKLTISQWPLYIDPGKRGTIADFEHKTGVGVHYTEDINDNAEFFGKLQPLLADGQSGGRDLITVSDWLARKMYDLGYLQRLDYSKLPNVKRNLIPFLQHPPADSNRQFTVPWQSGMTGLIVRTDLAPHVNSICDLFDPRYRGKVDMLSELRDSVPMTLKCMGIDPDKATTAQWLSAVDRLKAAADSGQIRRFTGNDYIRDLSSATSTSSSAGRGTRSRCRRTTRTSSS